MDALIRFATSVLYVLAGWGTKQFFSGNIDKYKILYIAVPILLAIYFLAIEKMYEIQKQNRKIIAKSRNAVIQFLALATIFYFFGLIFV